MGSGAARSGEEAPSKISERAVMAGQDEDRILIAFPYCCIDILPKLGRVQSVKLEPGASGCGWKWVRSCRLKPAFRPQWNAGFSRQPRSAHPHLITPGASLLCFPSFCSFAQPPWPRSLKRRFFRIQESDSTEFKKSFAWIRLDCPLDSAGCASTFFSQKSEHKRT